MPVSSSASPASPPQPSWHMQVSGGSALFDPALRHSVHDVDHRAGEVDLQHNGAAHRRQWQPPSPSVHRLMICPSPFHAPRASGEIGVIHRDLAQLVSSAQHDAFHAHAKPAAILQPGTRLGWRLLA
jgi:hypothetical protein